MKSETISGRVTGRRVLENIFTLFSARTLAQISVSIALLLAARTLGADNAGRYIACFALAKLSSVVFELGMDAWLLKEGGTHPVQVGKLISSIIMTKLISGLIWFCALWGLSLVLDEQTYPTDLLLIAALATWFESLTHTFLSGFMATLSNRKTAVLSIISSLLLTAATIWLIVDDTDIPRVYALMRLAVGALISAIAFFWISRENILKLSTGSIRDTIEKARPYFYSDALSILYTQSGITIVALLLGNYGAGIFGPALRIVSFLYLVPFSIFLVMVPTLSKLREESAQEFKSAIQRLLIGMIIVGALLWLIVGLIGKPLVELVLGSEFQLSGELLILLSVVPFSRTVSYGSASILVAADLQKKRVIVQAVSAALHLIAGIVLVSVIGLLGAVFALILSEVVLLIGYSYLTFNWLSAQALEWRPG